MGLGKLQPLVSISQSDLQNNRPLLFIISINDQHDETESSFCKFAEKWLVDQKIVLLFTGTLSGCRYGQARISCITANGNAKSCTWAPQRHQVICDPAGIKVSSLPGSIRQFTSRLVEMVLPLYSTLVRQTWNTGPVLGSSVEKKGKYWGNSCKQLLSG